MYDRHDLRWEPDLAPVIRQLWPIHKHHEKARDLLLRLVWLGKLRKSAAVRAKKSSIARPASPTSRPRSAASRSNTTRGGVTKKSPVISASRMRSRCGPSRRISARTVPPRPVSEALSCPQSCAGAAG